MITTAQQVQPKIQELASLDDLGLLVEGDVVNVAGRSPMRYHARVGEAMSFLGRDGNAIEWIISQVRDIGLRNNSLVFNKPEIDRFTLDARHPYIEFYHKSNNMLREAGL